MVYSISKELRVNWSDVIDGERIIMVVTIDKNPNINYKLIKTKPTEDNIPVFSLTIIYNKDIVNFLSFKSFHELKINITLLSDIIKLDSELENR